MRDGGIGLSKIRTNSTILYFGMLVKYAEADETLILIVSVLSKLYLKGNFITKSYFLALDLLYSNLAFTSSNQNLK